MFRRRSPEEIISLYGEHASIALAFDFARDAATSRIHRFLSGADVDKFSERLDQPGLEHRLHHIQDNQDALTEGREEADALLKDIVSVEDAVLPAFDDAYSDARLDEYLGSGRNADVYSIEGEQDKVMKILKPYKGNGLRSNRRHKLVEDQLSDHVGAVRTLDAGITEYEGEMTQYEGETTQYEVLDRAPGSVVHPDIDGTDQFSYQRWSEQNARLAAAPQEHYNELVQDAWELRRHDVVVDCKSGNLFYDETKGFTWVDVEKCSLHPSIGNPSYMANTVGGLGVARRFEPEQITAEDKQNTRRIADKAAFAARRSVDKDTVYDGINRLDESIDDSPNRVEAEPLTINSDGTAETHRVSL